MTPGCKLDGCARPALVGLPLCGQDRDALRDALARMPFLRAQLEVTATRQATMTPGGGSGGDRPLAFAWDSSELLWVMRNTLTVWARQVAAELSGRLLLLEQDGEAAGARYLLDRLGAVLRSPELVTLAEEVLALEAWCEAAIDRPEDRLYVGPCDDCGEDLYVLPDTAEAGCECGRTYDVRVRRTYLLELAEDRLAPAADLSRALTSLGAEVNPATIRKWASRGRLLARGLDRSGRPLYRVGDVLALR